MDHYIVRLLTVLASPTIQTEALKGKEL